MIISNNEATLGYFLLAVIAGFAILIYFLLKTRESLQQQDSKINPEFVWMTISEHALKFNLSKSNLLFGTYKDASSTKLSMQVKDIYGQTIGVITNYTMSRKKTFTIGLENYVIEFPLTWNRTAVLKSPIDGSIIAKYTKTGWPDRHQFEIFGHGLVKSERAFFNFKFTYDYKLNGNTIGTSQNISSVREQGKLLILPADISLAVKFFILAV